MHIKNIRAAVAVFMALVSFLANGYTANAATIKPPRLRAAAPNVADVIGIPADFSRNATVTMDGKKVSAMRYVAFVDGIEYEAFCCHPTRPGPENAGAVYSLSGEANAKLKNALVNGYPINTQWSSRDIPEDDRLWNVYLTRVAVAIANNPGNNFAGDSTAVSEATKLANGETIADHSAYPPIMVNGVKDATDTGTDVTGENAQSKTFVVTYNRKTNSIYNPFNFTWAAGTPDGAKLIVDGQLAATAPDNPTVSYNDLDGFVIEMPNTPDYQGKTAAVNLVGIHNQFADKIWLMQNPNDPDKWQDIVFYIPEMSASAAYSFQTGVEESGKSELRIVKRDNAGKGLAGAVFEITGPDGFSKQETSPADGVIKLSGLEAGEYTVTEVTPPAGYKLAEPATETLTIAADASGVIEKVFVNVPTDDTSTTAPTPEQKPELSPTSVKIQKVDALTRENIPGALMRLRGISSNVVVTGGTVPSTGDTHWTLNNTGIDLSQVLTAGAETASGEVKSTVKDGVWTLEGLPYGAYIVQEERAPDNYSLLPQHTSYGFWLLPPDVTVDVIDVNVIQDPATGEVLEKVADYEIREDGNVSSILCTFENYPFGQIEVKKYDMVTEEPLPGAHIRIQGYFPEGNTNGKPIDRVQMTGSDGTTVFADLPAGQYTLTEVEAPGGYELDFTEYRSLSLTWGQTACTSFYNKPKTFVEVVKIDGDDSSKLLDGAVFRLTDPTTGEIWEGTTEGGKVRLGIGDGSYGHQLEAGKLYILTEIQAPTGYILDQSPIEVIVAGNNQLNLVTVKNFLKPKLTLRKLDELTNKPVADASFRLRKTEGETWSETQVTDANGEIKWTDLDPGIYSLQEIDEPYGYYKDPARKEILLEGGDDKVLEFFNRPRPVLTMLKRDAVTGEPLENVKFRVQRLEGETIGEFLTDKDGRIELSPKTGYLLEEEVYRVTEVLPPNEYLLSANPQKDVLLKWHEPTELIFENLLKPTLIFIKRDGMSGRGISGATYKVEYESPMGGVTNMGSYVTKCGLIVIPHVLPGWYVFTETIPAPGYELPTNPVQRVHAAPGENSYSYEQTHEDLYVDDRTNPERGTNGACGDWCGFLCSVLCAGNCGKPGDGGMSPGDGGGFGNITITNGKGEPIGSGEKPTTPEPTPTPTTPPNFENAVVTGGTIVYLNPDFHTVVIKFGGY